MGKTAFALNIGAHLAFKGQNTLIFSMEMSVEEVEERIVFGESKVEGVKVVRGEVEARDMGRIVATTEKLKEGGKIVIDDSGATSPHAIPAGLKNP